MTAVWRLPIIRATCAQLLAAVAAIAVTSLLAGRFDGWLVRTAALFMQCVVALCMSRMFRLPAWWLWIAVAFPILLQLALSIDGLPAWPFGLAFLVLVLLFSNTARERVPLYLTNRQTAAALITLMDSRKARRFIDLGSGLGGVVRAVDGDGRSAQGVESAPLSWFLSWLLSKLSGRGHVIRQDLWSTNLSQEDVVYAFLSPAPMPRLWDKARLEMKAGSLLVSNSFAVPGVEADEIWELPDRRKTKLFLYSIGSQAK